LHSVKTINIPIKDGFIALLSPQVSGRLLAVNNPALTVFEAFKQPKCIEQVIGQLPYDHGQGVGVLEAVKQLWRNSFLVEDDTLMPHNSSQELVAWLHVTNECNLYCSYCYVDKTSDALDGATAQAAIEAVFRSAVLHGYRQVKLKYAGGEPLLAFKRVLSMQAHATALAAQQGIHLEATILSNGVALTQRHIEAMLAQRLHLMLSLDGIDRDNDIQRRFSNGKGSFRLIARAVRLALEAGLAPLISITVTPHNVDGLADTIHWILEQGLRFSINFYRPNSCAQNVEAVHSQEDRLIAGMQRAYRVIEEKLANIVLDYSLLDSLLDRANLSLLHERTCGVGENYLVIDHRGQIAKCHMVIGEQVADVHTNNPLQAIRSANSGIQNVPIQDKAECQSCEWRMWCAGGCPLTTYRATGRYDAKSPNCRIYRALFPEVIRLEGLRLLYYSPYFRRYTQEHEYLH
jgi:uncharacterized protein